MLTLGSDNSAELLSGFFVIAHLKVSGPGPLSGSNDWLPSNVTGSSTKIGAGGSFSSHSATGGWFIMIMLTIARTVEGSLSCFPSLTVS